MKIKKYSLIFLLVVLSLFTVSCKKDKHEHIYESTVVNPTCTEDGYTKYTCSCGETYNDNIVKALGHTIVKDPAISPTCEEKGKTEGEHCSVCDKVLVAQEDVKALGHTEEIDAEVLPTCTTTGLTEGKHCSVCDKVLLAQDEIKALGHTKTFTYYTDYHYPFCTVCNSELPKESHTFNNGVCECGYDVALSSGLEYELLENDTYMVKSVGTFSNSNLMIPNYYEGKAVTVIGASAFYGYIKLESVIIPNNIEIIDEYSFAECTELKTIMFEQDSKLTTIGSSAFVSCTSLENIKIPNSVSSLGTGAFGDCISLKEFPITSETKLTKLEEYLFYSCDSLKEAIIPSSIESMGEGVFYYCIDLRKIEFEKGSKISEIPDYSFTNCKMLQSIVIPNNVTKIGSCAFFECKSLSSFVLPSTIELIDYYAFGDCRRLYEIYNLSLLEIVDSESDHGYIGYYAKYIHTSLDEESHIFTDENGFVFMEKDDEYYLINYVNENPNVVLPNNFNGKEYSLYECAFLQSNIKSVVLQEGLEEIAEYAFCGCGNLETITLPSTLLSINYGAFDDCYKLFEIYNLSTMLDITLGSNEDGGIGKYAKKVMTSLNEETEEIIDEDGFVFKKGSDNNYYLCGYDINKKEIILPNNCNNNKYYINEYLFKNSNIEKLVVSSGVISISDNAFSDCLELKEVILEEGINSIGEYAFSFCESLTSITIPKSVKTIKKSAFYYCQNLTEVNLSPGVERIEESAFKSCFSLENLIIPNSVTYIGVSAFENCKKLKSIKLSENLTKIDMRVFCGCKALESIIISNDILEISANAFMACDNLSKIYYLGTNEEWDAINISAANIDVLLSDPYIYSSIEPTVEGNYWHYDTDGITPIEW